MYFCSIYLVKDLVARPGKLFAVDGLYIHFSLIFLLYPDKRNECDLKHRAVESMKQTTMQV
jgi:hypothetical protein